MIESGDFSSPDMPSAPINSWVKAKEIHSLSQTRCKYHDNERCLEIDLGETIKAFNIQLPFKPLAEKHNDDNSLKQLINKPQNHFNELAAELDEAGQPEPAKALATAANMLNKTKTCDNAEQLHTSTALKRVKRIINDIDNKKSKLSLAIKNSYYGEDILKEIIQDYQRLNSLL